MIELVRFASVLSHAMVIKWFFAWHLDSIYGNIACTKSYVNPSILFERSIEGVKATIRWTAIILEIHWVWMRKTLNSNESIFRLLWNFRFFFYLKRNSACFGFRSSEYILLFDAAFSTSFYTYFPSVQIFSPALSLLNFKNKKQKNVNVLIFFKFCTITFYSNIFQRFSNRIKTWNHLAFLKTQHIEIGGSKN